MRIGASLIRQEHAQGQMVIRLSGVPDPQRSTAMTRKSPQSLQGLRCLILESDLPLLLSWSSFLERRGVQIIGTATDTLQALAIAEGESPDFALLAADLPGTDTRMQAALALSETMKLPVLSLSAEGRLRNISPPGWLWAQSKGTAPWHHARTGRVF